LSDKPKSTKRLFIVHELTHGPTYLVFKYQNPLFRALVPTLGRNYWLYRSDSCCQPPFGFIFDFSLQSKFFPLGQICILYIDL